MRYVIDSSAILHLLDTESARSSTHRLLAPTLVRSQVLDALYRRRDSMTWKVAEELGWDTTADAEFITLTQLQGDALVTRDENRASSAARLVAVAPIRVLLE